MERIDAALAFARLGCRILPAAGKNPGGYVGSGWQRHATTDPGLIRSWWEAWPDANVAIVPGRALLPVDIDDRESFRQFQAERGNAPRTPAYLSGGDGERARLLFRFPGDQALEGVSRKLAPGVQLRHAHNSALICIVPPGVNPDTGRALTWVRGLDTPLAPFPTRWLEEVTAPANGRPLSHWAQIARHRYVTRCGDTHPDVLSFAGWLMRHLKSEDVVLELLLGWNDRHCNPPKPRDEVRAIVEWTAREEARRQARMWDLGNAGLRKEGARERA